MGTSRYVGRVGALAMALGIGAAIVGGTAVSWADDGAGSAVSSDATGRHTPAGAPASGSAENTDQSATTARRAPAGRGRDAEPDATTAGDGDFSAPVTALPDADSAPETDSALETAEPSAPAVAAVPAPAAAEAVTEPVTEADLPETTPVESTAAGAISATDTPAGAEAAGSSATGVATPEPTVEPTVTAVDVVSPAPVAAPTSAPVTSFLAAALNAIGDPFAGGNPGVPVDSPLDWAALAFARRQPLAAATSLQSPAATTSTVATSTVATTTAATLIMGPSGVPVPSVAYGDTVMNYYIPGNVPGTQQLVFTPEGLYPITGVKSLPLNTSVDQGIEIIARTLGGVPAGTPTTVFGYSQSAIIASLLQQGYTVDKVDYTVPEGLPVNFVLVGNEMNPDGGFLSRFSGRDMPMLSLTSLGIDFYGATPENLYPTTNYTQEYDGFADFPRYPLNFLADLNAGLGIVFVHTKYTPSPDELANCKAYCLTKEQVENAIALPTTDPTQQYRFIPIENLPLLQPLRFIPLVGNPLADLMQPVLKVIVDLGYGDPAHGFITGTQPYANVLQPFGVFPDVEPGEVLTRLVDGVQQGITDFLAAFVPNGPLAQEMAALSAPTSAPLALSGSGDVVYDVQNLIDSTADFVSNAAASIYAALLPTADIINSLLTTLPAYNVNLFLYGIQQALNGDIIAGLVNSIGLPLAADVGLVTTAGLVGALVWGQALADALAL